MEFAIGQRVIRKQTGEVLTIKEARVLKEGVFYFVEENDSCFSQSCLKEIIDINMEELNTGDLVVCKENTVWKVLKDTAWGDVYVTRTSMGVVTRTDLDIIDVISPIYRFELLDDFLKEMSKNCR